MKICFVSDVHYPNYTKRVQESSLKSFLDYELFNHDIHYYISTNRPKDLMHLDGINNVRIFDIDELRKTNKKSIEYEILRKNPVGTYPSIFPYNLRRFIIEKAALDGFDYIIFLDADVVFRQNIPINDFIYHLKSKYEPNKVKTNVHIFRYSPHSDSEVFSQHNKYLENLFIDFSNKSLDTLDGPVMIFMGKTSEDIIRLTNNWHYITHFGYEKPYGFGYENFFIANLSFVIPMSDFELISDDFPFYPNHIFEDRYDAVYQAKEGEFDDETEPINHNITNNNNNNNNNVKEKNLYKILESYSCRRSYNGFSNLFENYLKSIENNSPNLLEIGVGTVSLEPPIGRNYVPENMYTWKESHPNYFPGNSLRSLRDYMNTGNYYGVDIQKDCLINEDRIQTFIFDSRDPSKREEYLQNLTFDFIIDDSDKDVNIRIITFNNFYHLLKDDGYYVIEGLLEEKFLQTYFNYFKIPFIIVQDFIIINKNNNFDPISYEDDKKKVLVIDHNFEKENIDYKSIIEKTPKFSINNSVLADKGFYINLKKSVDRKDKVELMINNHNIEGLIRFGALTDEMIQYACTKSHMGVFKVAMENNLDTIFVAEDDFDIKENLYSPNTEVINFYDKIKLLEKDLENLHWDVFLFGCNPKSHLIPITKNVAVVNKSTGAWAYLIKKTAYTYLLENINYKRDYIAIDDYLPLLNDLGFTTLTSIPMTIGHSVGFVSTLQPRGPVNYTDWINGNYHQFLFDNYHQGNFTDDTIEKNLTICIPGFFCDNYLFYLRYALKTLPEELKKCKILIRFDTSTVNPDLSEFIKLQAYIRDVRGTLNITLTHGFGGLLASFDYFMKNIKTDFFLMYEFDYLFLNNTKIEFKKIIDCFKKYNFINSVYLSGDDISVRGFDLATDKNGRVTPFEVEKRVNEISLVTTARWSNRPGLHRVSKMREWFDKYMYNDKIGEVHFGCHGVEDSMIPVYTKTINENSWEDIKDDWGTYLYGNMGDGPFIAHTDSSRRYQNEIKSTLEINAENFVLANPLTEND